MTITPPPLVATIEPTGTNWNLTGAGSVRTTAAFNVTAGDVLLAVSACESDASAINTPSGGSLIWTSVKATSASGAAGTDARSWTATVDTTKSMTFSLTAGLARQWGFILYQYSGSDGVGASAITEQTSGSVTATRALTPLQDNSAIVAISADWNAVDGAGAARTWTTINSITPTIGNGLEKSYYRDALAYTVYSAYWNDVGAIASKTAGLSAPSGQRNSIIAVEIKGTSAVAASNQILVPRSWM